MSWLIRFYDPAVFWLDSTFTNQIIKNRQASKEKKPKYYI